MPTCCVGSATSIDGYGDARRHKRHGSGSSTDILGSSPTEPGSTCRPLPDDQDDKSRVTGDCYARICGSRRVRPPPATRQGVGPFAAEEAVPALLVGAVVLDAGAAG